MRPLSILLLLVCCAASPDPHDPRDPDWLLYRDHGRLCLIDTIGAIDSHVGAAVTSRPHRWEGSGSRISIERDNRHLVLLYAADVANTPWYADLQLDQSPDGTVMAMWWGCGDNGKRTKRVYPSFDAAYADPDVNRMLAPALASVGQNPRILDAFMVRSILSGPGRCTQAVRTRIVRSVRELDDPGPQVRRRAYACLSGDVAAWLPMVADPMDLTIPQRRAVEAIERSCWICGSGELFLQAWSELSGAHLETFPDAPTETSR